MNSQKVQIGNIRFLIATDIHLGHSQNHHELGNDSYDAFDEVLNIAKKQDVDFLLLGGDLFDEVNPSQKCLYKCLNKLKQKVFGDKEFMIQVSGCVPNFYGNDVNIALPIFTIHGNHDYPSIDFGKISVCDLLHASSYVNYFGKYLSVTDQEQKKIVVKPLIFKKKGSNIKLSLYGLGYIKDIKLHKMLQDGTLVFEEPQKKDSTCILILHQNRYKGKKNGVGASFQQSIPAQFLPKWMDLIIWGHEHQAISVTQQENDIKIFQPGSTVITSFIEAESYKKQCGLITIKGAGMLNINPIALQRSFRPMVVHSKSLVQIDESISQGLVDYIKYFDDEIKSIFALLAQKNIRKKPIIRIKIDYTGHEMIRMIKIEEKYRDLVANSNKIFTYVQKKQPKQAFLLQDKAVMQMIQTSHFLTGGTRQKQVTEDIMEIFCRQALENKFSFFDFDTIKQKLKDFSGSETKATPSQIKQFYIQEIRSKTLENKKKISQFHNKNKNQFRRIEQKLQKAAQGYISGKQLQDFSLQDIKADISRMKQSYVTKYEQVKDYYQIQLDRPSSTQVPSKSTNKTEKQLDGKKKSTIQVQRNHMSDPHFHQKGIDSDQEDCCQKAARQQYNQNEARMRFKKANEMVNNQQKQLKTKKSVKFNDELL